MIINKITTGFVIQSFDTDTGTYTHQHFVAGDEVDYENVEGHFLSNKELAKFNFGPDAKNEPCMPFDMVQPSDRPIWSKTDESDSNVHFHSINRKLKPNE